ncbi:uncharacterized protein LOC132744361 [Ruditapes philippinarum]|uniref:uncharacterized protein LOC132744361 n=1 Tax=Ruditapes philippinarum TaxID=129788 RepID=UPI00295C152F|nr:uncharacterized protein LOC132744361 [Ruditapes philippinarum]
MKSELILIYLTCVLVQALIVRNSDEIFECDAYENITNKFDSCFKSESNVDFERMLRLFNYYDNVDPITKEDILTEVGLICSATDRRDAFVQCKNNIVEECPDVEPFITAAFKAKFDFFCKDEQPSEWIQDVFYEGYQLTMLCEGNVEVFESLGECTQTSGITDGVRDVSNLNTTFAWSRIQSLLQDWFECAVPEESLSDELGCGSTKADFLTAYAVFVVSTTNILSPPFGEVAKQRLLSAVFSSQQFETVFE